MQSKIARHSIGAVCFLAALALSAGMAHAYSNYLTDFTTYAATLRGSTATGAAGCQVCHTTTNGGPRNVYGTDYGSNGHNFAAIETFDSDGVGGNNREEIMAGTQPGWCDQTNPLCSQKTGTPPNVPLDRTTAANQPPVLVPIGNQQALENTRLSFTIRATDDGPATALRFTTVGTPPTGATLTDNLNGTATFAWTPSYTQGGGTTPYPVTIRVTDAGGLTASETFNITVGDVNRAPSLAPNPVGNRTVTEGTLLEIAFNGSDPDGDRLTFSTLPSPLPNGASLAAGSTNIATFSWRPATGQASSTPYPVTITVTDPGGLTASQSFTITVQAPTSSPICTMTISPTSLAFGSVNVGSSKTMTTAIGNSGTANCTVSSLTVSGAGFALGSGAPSLPATVAPGATVNVPVNFAPAAAGVASGSLTIGSAVVSLSGTGATVTAPPPTTGAVDYNVQAFKATEEVELSKKQSVRLKLTVKNVGKVPGDAPAIVVGMQNGSEVYRKTMAVSAPAGKTGTFDFPSYTPTAAGKIKWTVTIRDQGPARRKTATATTEVKGEDKQETEHSDRKRS